MTLMARLSGIAKRPSLVAAALAAVFAVWVSFLVPWWEIYQRNADEGLNLGKAALVAAGWPPYGQLWNDQPPVLTYILAGLQFVLPGDVAAARTVVLLFAGLLLISLYRIVYRTSGHTGALLAVGLLGTSVLFLHLSVSVMIGLPAVALAVCSLDIASHNQRRSILRLLIAGAVMGLSLQTKLFTLTALLPLALLAWTGAAEGLGQRAARTVVCLAGAAVTFVIVALISGEPIMTQLVGAHIDQDLREAYSLSTSLTSIWNELARQKPLLLATILGLALGLWRRPVAVSTPLVWLTISFVSLALHTPVWGHQVLLLLVPSAWIVGTGWGTWSKGGWGQGLRIASAAVLLLISTADGGFRAYQRPASEKDPGYAAADILARYAPLGEWVLSDTPIDAFRAGILVPPEIVVFSAKRQMGGNLNWEEMLAVLDNYRPAQVLLRRFDVDPRVQERIERDYYRTYNIAELNHFVRKGAVISDVDKPDLLDALGTMADVLLATSVEGGFAGLTDTRNGLRYDSAATDLPLPERAITMRPPGSTPRAAQCLLRLAKITPDDRYRAAAVAAGKAVVCAQGNDGGWAPSAPLADNCAAVEPPVRPAAVNVKNSLDEGGPSEAISLLLDLRELAVSSEQAMRFEMSARAGLDFLVNSQNADGGWPLTPLASNYRKLSALNDGVTTAALGSLLVGAEEFSDSRYRDAALKGVEFLLSRQSDEGAWAQQYDASGAPAAARAYEPAAHASLETARALIGLAGVYTVNSRPEILDAIRRGRDWLITHQVAPQIWSRLYEIGTGRPIFGDRDGVVHYSIDELSEERAQGYRWVERFPEVMLALRVADAALANPTDIARANTLQMHEQQLADFVEGHGVLSAFVDSNGVDADGFVSVRRTAEICELAAPAIELSGF